MPDPSPKPFCASGRAFGGKPDGLRLERMRSSPRFFDGLFRNTARVQPGLKPGTALSTISKFLFGGERRTPPAPLPTRNPLDDWARPIETGLRATWLGHSTVLIEIDGFRVLTDPVWGERASPWQFAGPKRFQPVPIPIEALPPLDAVVISHDHYDHLDYPSIRALAARDAPFITALGVGAHLESWGIPAARITELDWWEHLDLHGGALRITAAPSQHFSGRAMNDRNRTLWSSMAIRTDHHSVFFSGDTGLTPEYGDIRSRLGPFDLVMLEIGAFHPAWGDIHLGPENALEAHALLGGGCLLPVHWGTFNLAIHAWDEPAETILDLARRRGALLAMPGIGVPVEPGRIEGEPEPWWRAAGVVEAANVPAVEPESAVVAGGPVVDAIAD